MKYTCLQNKEGEASMCKSIDDSHLTMETASFAAFLEPTAFTFEGILEKLLDNMVRAQW